MKHHQCWMLALAVLLAACSRPDSGAVDPGLASEIGRIRAIDNHAHPVRVILNGPADREFDALPVDNMEPASDPVNARPMRLRCWKLRVRSTAPRTGKPSSSARRAMAIRPGCSTRTAST